MFLLAVAGMLAGVGDIRIARFLLRHKRRISIHGDDHRRPDSAFCVVLQGTCQKAGKAESIVPSWERDDYTFLHGHIYKANFWARLVHVVTRYRHDALLINRKFSGTAPAICQGQ